MEIRERSSIKLSTGFAIFCWQMLIDIINYYEVNYLDEYVMVYERFCAATVNIANPHYQSNRNNSRTKPGVFTASTDTARRPGEGREAG